MAKRNSSNNMVSRRAYRLKNRLPKFGSHQCKWRVWIVRKGRILYRIDGCTTPPPASFFHRCPSLSFNWSRGGLKSEILVLIVKIKCALQCSFRWCNLKCCACSGRFGNLNWIRLRLNWQHLFSALIQFKFPKRPDHAQHFKGRVPLFLWYTSW